jgi:survival of motor neuron-related-splicing factor 30
MNRSEAFSIFRGSRPSRPTANRYQLDIVQAQLKGDPDNAELNSLRTELDEMIALLNESLSELKPKQAKPAPTPQERAPRESQARKPAAADDRDAGKEGVVAYQVNDNVMAKWVSGDKAFYPARITSITGSSTDPVYIVKFKSYDTTETLRARDIRPVSNKRKADGTPASSAPTQAAPSAAAASNNGVVLSAAAKPNPDHQQQQAKRDAERNQALDSNGKPPKAKKIKANKELEAGKNKWQEFNAKSKFA